MRIAVVSECMSQQDTVKYQFRVDRDTWENWKRTVPRTISLETRIIELLKADLEDHQRAAEGGSSINHGE